MDLLYWEISTLLHRHTRMVIEMAKTVHVFFDIIDSAWSIVDNLFWGDTKMCPGTHFLVFSGERILHSSWYENDLSHPYMLCLLPLPWVA